MTESFVRVFVYGTLRSDGINFAVAEGSGLISVRPAAAHGLLLYHLDLEGYPAVVPGDGIVFGETLTLAGGLDALDRLEGLHLDPPLYRRERWSVRYRVGSGSAWIYLLDDTTRLAEGRAHLIRSGVWQIG